MELPYKGGSKLGAGHPHHDAAPPRKWGRLLSRLGKGTAPPPPLHPPPAGVLAPLHPEKKPPAIEARPAATPPQKSRSGSEVRQRKHSVRVRLDDAERTTLEACAGGLSLSAYMRARSFGDAGPRARRRAPVDRDLLARTNAELNRVGNNLNQIARTLNIAAQEEPSRELKRVVAGLDRPMAAAIEDVSATLAAIRQALGYDRQG